MTHPLQDPQYLMNIMLTLAAVCIPAIIGGLLALRAARRMHPGATQEADPDE